MSIKSYQPILKKNLNMSSLRTKKKDANKEIEID